MAKVYAVDYEGIKLNSDCMAQWNCELNVYQLLQIREENPENNAKVFVQDAFLWATMFIGTLAVVGMLISGMLMVFGGGSESMYDKGKKGFKYSIIGLLLVILSYTLIRVVQYVAQGRAS